MGGCLRHRRLGDLPMSTRMRRGNACTVPDCTREEERMGPDIGHGGMKPNQQDARPDQDEDQDQENRSDILTSSSPELYSFTRLTSHDQIATPTTQSKSSSPCQSRYTTLPTNSSRNKCTCTLHKPRQHARHPIPQPT